MERLIDIKLSELNPTIRAMSDAGATTDDAAWLRSPGNAALALDFIRRQRAVLQGDHIIDCDAAPFTPDSWKVEEHEKGGQFVWDAAKVALHLEPEQVNGSLVGTTLRKRLKRLRKLNANVLDYLLKNPHLIPEEWKGKYVFFWGTVYRRAGGRLYVRCLYWVGSSWRWNDYWVGLDWNADYSAALAS